MVDAEIEVSVQVSPWADQIEKISFLPRLEEF